MRNVQVEHFNGDRYQFVVNELVEQISGNSSGRMNIFDVGAGQGEVGEKIRQLHGRSVYYREFDKYPSNDSVQELDIEEHGPDGAADVLVFMECVEHLWNPGRAINNLAKAVKPGGTLLLTTPNPAWSRSRVHFAFRDTVDCFTSRDLESNHHVFTPWRHILYRLLDVNGFSVQRHVTLEGRLKAPNRPMSLSYPMRLAAWGAARTIEMRHPASRGMSYALVASRHSH